MVKCLLWLGHMHFIIPQLFGRTQWQQRHYLHPQAEIDCACLPELIQLFVYMLVLGYTHSNCVYCWNMISKFVQKFLFFIENSMSDFHMSQLLLSISNLFLHAHKILNRVVTALSHKHTLQGNLDHVYNLTLICSNSSLLPVGGWSSLELSLEEYITSVMTAFPLPSTLVVKGLND